MNEKSKEILIKYYVNGKSYDDLIIKAKDLKIDENISELLKLIDNDNRLG